jgi:hypothetical protein
VALGELKGMSIIDPEEKELFLKSFMKENPFVEKFGNYGNIGFWLKIKNPAYSFALKHNGTSPGVIYDFKKLENHIDDNILVLPLTRKYFHDVLENMPLILTLKEQNEDFKVVLTSHENTKDGIFPSFLLDPAESSEDTGVSLKYWKDFLDHFEIKYECKTINTNAAYHNFSSNSGYVFYYSDLGLGIEMSHLYHNTTGLRGNDKNYGQRHKDLHIKNCYQILPLFYYTNLLAADSYEILKRNFKPAIKDTVPGKKIFITRDTKKFMDRSIENSDLITNYMRNKNFEILYQENLSMMEQISYVTQAECVVALVGSSFINVMFCNPNTQLFIIHTDKSQDFGIYFNQSARYDIDAKTVYCDPDGNSIIDYFETSDNKTTLRWIHGSGKY